MPYVKYSPIRENAQMENVMGQNERVTVKEAAQILGMSQQGVREHMKRNLFTVPIGYVTKIGRNNQYHIYRKMLNRHIGIDTN